MTEKLSRRSLLKTASLAGAAAVSPALPAPAAETVPMAPETPAHVNGEELRFLSEVEARFIAAAIDRLIPGDADAPGALDAGVLTYIDRQLASPYGAGARMYLRGPWAPEAPAQQGYQLRLSPAQLYRTAIAEIREALNGREFWDLEPAEQDDALRRMEAGRMALASVPSAVFFETLLANTVEGYFSDPAYGGNRNMIGWRLVGFPGAYAEFINLVDKHGYEYAREPVSIAARANPVTQEHKM